MNDDQEQLILTEIRKMQRSLQSVAFVGITALLAVLVFYIWFSRPRPVTRANLWGAAHEAMVHLEYERAASLVQQIVAKYPGDYNGYAYLGMIALISGHVKQAEGYYTQADKLFPSEYNEKMLATVRARLAKEKTQTPPATP